MQIPLMPLLRPWVLRKCMEEVYRFDFPFTKTSADFRFPSLCELLKQ